MSTMQRSHHQAVETWRFLALGTLGATAIGSLSATANSNLLRTPMLLRAGRRRWFGDGTCERWAFSTDRSIESRRVRPVLLRTRRWT